MKANRGAIRPKLKPIFIDRDGVINKDPGGWTEHSYVTDPKDFHFLPGSLEALRKLKENHYRVIIISNQAGVNKGYFTVDRLNAIDKEMLREVKKAGGEITESFYCIHKKEDNCNCRKPKTGLLEKAAKKYGIDTGDTYFIGDSEADVIAGKKMGSKTIFVLSGKTSEEEIKGFSEKPDYVFKDLLEAVNWLLAKESRRNKRVAERRAS
jgi:D-glycero-D-manno-heptose 1,7-bisphosphate phosphatase